MNEHEKLNITPPPEDISESITSPTASPYAAMPDTEPSTTTNKIEPGLMRPDKPVAQEEKFENTIHMDVRGPGIIVLQWLTYAAWGLTLIALSTLSVMVMAYYMIKNTDVGDFPLYSMAAVLVLLPIAVICDLLYIKKEPEQKIGAASAVTVVHAVIYALFAIGSFITVVFSAVGMAISFGDSDMTKVVMYGALLITFLFTLLFLRTIAPPSLYRFRKPFVILMILVVGTVFAFSLFGPFKAAMETRNDRLIEENISNVVDGVSAYANKNSKLPNSLGDLELTGGAKKLVDEKLVTFKKDSYTPTKSSSSYSYYPQETAYYYQLCVVYKKEKKSSYYPSYYKDSDTSYSTYVSTYTHPAGNKCYKLQTSRYGGIEPATDGSDSSTSSDGSGNSSGNTGTTVY